jgi:hypothetical protein
MHNENSIHFQGKDPSEVLQFYFRQHWIRMVKPTVGVLFLTLVLIVIGALLLWSVGLDQSTTRHSVLLLLIAFLLAVQFRFLNRFYCYFLYLVIVTDRKVHRIKKNLFTLDTHQSVDMWSLQDLKKSQRGPIQNLFGFGTIVLEAQDTQLRLHFCPRVTEHYEALLHLLEMNRNDRTESDSRMRSKGAQSWN